MNPQEGMIKGYGILTFILCLYFNIAKFFYVASRVVT
jgi:hypothetical protein